MYNYDSDTPFIANTDEYPSVAQRSQFLEAYIANGRDTVENKEEAVRNLEKEIRDWRVLSHAFWCVWAIVMSGDDPEFDFPNGNGPEIQAVRKKPSMDESRGVTTADFDYIAYADQKMRLFWGELASGRLCDGYKDSIEGSMVIND
jgi:thiamine kinase-like enzyme